MSGTVIITNEEYTDLLTDSDFLMHLFDSGLDNWEGLQPALDSFDVNAEGDTGDEPEREEDTASGSHD